GHHAGALQLWYLGWGADYPDAEDFTSLFSAGSPNNASNYHDGLQGGQNFTVWQILAKADVEQNKSVRMALYNQAEQLLINDIAWIPLLQGANAARLKPYIQGYVPSALNLISDKDWPNVVVLSH